MILPKEFYEEDAITVAKKLLGKVLVRKVDGKVIKCKIVETESYIGDIDKDILKSKGVEEIASVGETFDPSQHEAVTSIQDPEKGVQEIVQEYRKGYKIGSKVIRHSMVVVAN